MTTFDLVVTGIVLLSAAVGAWRGLIGEAIAVVAWVFALLAAWLFGAELGESLFSGMDPALRTMLGFGSIIVAVLILMALLKLLLRALLKALGMNMTDRLLGALFGLARGLVIVVVLVAAGGLVSAPKQSWWKEASLAPPLETVVLALRPMLPPDIAKRIRY